jgi:hypothetical protein
LTAVSIAHPVGFRPDVCQRIWTVGLRVVGIALDGNRCAQKRTDILGDLGGVGLQRKVPGVEQMHLRVWQISPEGLRAGGQQGRIVLAPGCQKRRLVVFTRQWLRCRLLVHNRKYAAWRCPLQAAHRVFLTIGS